MMSDSTQKTRFQYFPSFIFLVSLVFFELVYNLDRRIDNSRTRNKYHADNMNGVKIEIRYRPYSRRRQNVYSQGRITYKLFKHIF